MGLSLPVCRRGRQDRQLLAQPTAQRRLGQAFFRKAVLSQGRLVETITLDGYPASHRAVHELQQQGKLLYLMKLRSSKYLNNLIEQDNHNVKSRLSVMLDLKSFATVATTIRGIELMRRIRKG